MTMGTMEVLQADDGARIAFYHVPPVGQRRGGLVLLQEIFGLTEHIKEACDGWAAHGFEVVAPALFDREAPGLQASYAAEEIARCVQIAREQHPFELTVADVQASINLFHRNGPVFVLGYCYGGSASWAAACRCDGVTAASSYYGSHVIRMVEETPQVPIMLHFGDRDTSIPKEEIDRITDRHPYLPIHIYSAGHGFNSDRREDYDAASASLARDRSVSFFNACGAII
jgi:carboxymethylenebutenolidase